MEGVTTDGLEYQELDESRSQMSQASENGTVMTQKEQCPYAVYQDMDTLTELTKADRNIWGRGDISETDEEKYKERLSKAEKQDVLDDMHISCNKDQLRRFRLAHDHLKQQNKLCYSDKDFNYGDTQMDNMLLYSMAVEAWEISKFLINTDGTNLIMQKCQNKTGRGATVLHLAIVKHEKSILQLILYKLCPELKKQLIGVHGEGNIFRGHFKNCSNPLSLAIYCGLDDVFFRLVVEGGDLESQEERSGNGIMHTLVEYGLIDEKKAVEMYNNIMTNNVTRDWYCSKYSLAVEEYTPYEQAVMKTRLLKMTNKHGYNVLAYCAKLGVHDLLISIMNCEGVYKKTKWKLDTRCMASYDITEIDPTIGYLERPNSPCVLEHLMYERNEDDIPSLCEEPLKTLMEVKWKQFRIPYTLAALFHFVVICVQTHLAVVSCVLAHDNSSATEIRTQYESEDPYKYAAHLMRVGFVCVTIITILYLLLELVEIFEAVKLLIKGQLRWRPESKHYKTPWSIILKLDQFDIMMSIYGISSLVFLPQIVDTSEFTGDGQALAIALASGWYFMLFYTRAYRPTSFFNVMLGRMFFSDLLRFSIALAAFIVGFGVGLMALVANASGELPDSFVSFSECVKTMILILVGMGDTDFLADAKHPKLSTFMTFLYIIIGMILLMNMLIAAMSDTYASLSGAKENLWLKMRLFSIMVIERRLPSFLLRELVRVTPTITRDSPDKSKPSTWSLQVETEKKGGKKQVIRDVTSRVYANLLR